MKHFIKEYFNLILCAALILFISCFVWFMEVTHKAYTYDQQAKAIKYCMDRNLGYQQFVGDGFMNSGYVYKLRCIDSQKILYPIPSEVYK